MLDEYEISYLDYFPVNLGAFGQQQGEQFQQDLKDVEKRYQSVEDKNMLTDYCWGLKRDTAIKHKRNALRRTFDSKKTSNYKEKE